MSLLSLLLACSLAQAPSVTPEPEIVLEMGRVRRSAPLPGVMRFSHKVHTSRKLKTKCEDCHRLGVDGNRFRPSEVKSCTPCHKEKSILDEFKAAMEQRTRPAPVKPVDPIHRIHQYYDCTRCHGNITVSEKIGDFPLPPADNSSDVCVTCHARAVTFSHERHTRVDGKVVADCSFCHSPRPDGIWYSVPGHPQCWQCHDINLLGLTEGCNLCHLKDARAPKTYKIERASTLHKEHPRDKVACVKCHEQILGASTLEELRAARESASGAVCASCHPAPK